MRNPQLLLIVILALFVSAAHAQDAKKKAEQKGKPAIEKIELDRAKIMLPCPSGQRTPESCSDSTVVVAKAVLAGTAPNGAKFQATVSGGRVIKNDGAEFQWDLAGVYPGTYTISIATVDSTGKASDPVTGMVQIAECPECGYHDPCPSVSIDNPEPVEAGEVMVFKATATGGQADSINFDWTISAGMIESGQGTPTIKVRTNRSMAGQIVIATVTLGGVEPATMCSSTVSAAGQVLDKPSN